MAQPWWDRIPERNFCYGWCILFCGLLLIEFEAGDISVLDASIKQSWELLEGDDPPASNSAKHVIILVVTGILKKGRLLDTKPASETVSIAGENMGFPHPLLLHGFPNYSENHINRNRK